MFSPPKERNLHAVESISNVNFLLHFLFIIFSIWSQMQSLMFNSLANNQEHNVCQNMSEPEGALLNFEVVILYC